MKERIFFDEDDSVCILSYKDEIWKKLNTELYPNISPIYWISTKARIYNCKTNRLLKPRCLDAKKHVSPYWKVNLQVIINNKSYGETFLIHRLLLSTFTPIDNMKNLLVNHIDGNKLNDDFTNLEWVTNSENIIHAYRTGLFIPSHGENHCCATITEKEALKIIDMLLSRNFTHLEISKVMRTSVSIVDSIACKKSWKHLTKDLDFSSLQYRIPKKMTFDDIEGCCEYFELYKKPADMSVRRHCMNALNYINYQPHAP